jgi:hypothetical protein
MGVWLEARTGTTCQDLRCITKTAIETAIKKTGVALSQDAVKEHAERLARIIEEEHFGPYKFTAGDLEIAIHDIDYDVECLEGCKGEVEVKFEVDGSGVRHIVEKILRDMGLHNVKICE